MTRQLAPGAKIRHYVLQRQLGVGASGEVWAASDDGRTVAIKLIHERLVTGGAAEEHLQRLQNEITLLQKLDHPHIPALYDHDLAYFRPYLVMEYSAEKSYEILIASGEMLPIPVRKRLDALMCIAQTLTTVHNAGIIHRDIKPASLSGIQHPYLLDFSIAINCEDAAHTRQDVGTAIYMPPLESPPGVFNDYYSFSLVAYEVLLGAHPIFTAQNIGRTSEETRSRARDAIKSALWRRSGRLAVEALPGDLYGANLDRLDDVFQQAFEGHFAEMTAFVDALEQAILVPENHPYLDHPVPVFVPRPIPEEKHYTDHEVERAHQDTDVGDRVKFRAAIPCNAGLIMLALVGIAVMVYLFQH